MEKALLCAAGHGGEAHTTAERNWEGIQGDMLSKIGILCDKRDATDLEADYDTGKSPEKAGITPVLDVLGKHI